MTSAHASQSQCCVLLLQGTCWLHKQAADVRYLAVAQASKAQGAVHMRTQQPTPAGTSAVPVHGCVVTVCARAVAGALRDTDIGKYCCCALNNDVTAVSTNMTQTCDLTSSAATSWLPLLQPLVCVASAYVQAQS